MRKEKVFGLLKIIIFTISIALGISLLLQYIPNSIVRIIVASLLFLAVFVFLFKKHKESILLISIPAAIALVMPFYAASAVIQMVMAVMLLALIVICLFKKEVPSPFKVVMAFIAFTVLLTWILPTTYYSYSLVSDGTLSEIGLFDILSYGNVSLSYFGNIAFYILSIGIFYGVLHKIGAYRTLLERLANKARVRGGLLTLSIIMFVFTALSSVSGLSMGLWIVIPFVTSLILLMGYDKITAALVTIGSICVGMIGTTLSSTYIAESYNVDAQNGMGVLNSLLSTNQKSLIWFKIAILALGFGLLVFNTLRHANKTRNIENKKDELVPTVEDKNAKVWPLVVIIDALLIIVALSMTSWTSVFKVQFFDKLTTSALGKFGLLLGEVGAFERWSVTEVASLMIFASIIVALIYKVKIGEYISSALEGIKKALKPAMLAILIYVVLVAVSYNPIVLTIIKPLISKHLNVFTMGVSAFVASIFNVDMYYAAQSTLPYITSVITKTQVYPSIALIWQIMYGFTSLVAPTSIILIPVLSYLGISYKDWFKSNWMFILEVLLLCVLTFIALLLFV